MLKRFLAGLLTAAMLVTSPGFTDAAYATEQENSVTESPVAYEGSSSVGELIATSLTDKQAELSQNYGFNVFSVDFTEAEPNKAVVSLEAFEDCTLVVALYDEFDNSHMLVSKSVEIAAVRKRQSCILMQQECLRIFTYVPIWWTAGRFCRCARYTNLPCIRRKCRYF